MKKTKEILALILLVFTTLNAFSQEQGLNKDWIVRLSDYRSYLLQRNPNATSELKTLLDKWTRLGTTESERTKMTLNILNSSQIQDHSYQLIKYEAVLYMPDSNISNNLSDTDIEIICKNSELLDLIQLGLLKSKYPFVLAPKSNIFTELSAYNITSSDKIADIGCGTGMMGFLFNIIEPQATVYLNELNNDFLKYIRQMIDLSKEDYDAANIHLVEGEKKSTTLEGYELDKIIVRSTFHHFKKKKQMLTSIKNALKADGELFILEQVKDFDTDNDICEKAMDSKDEIIEIISSNGFDLIEEIRFDEEILLKFKISSK